MLTLLLTACAPYAPHYDTGSDPDIMELECVGDREYEDGSRDWMALIYDVECVGDGHSCTLVDSWVEAFANDGHGGAFYYVESTTRQLSTITEVSMSQPSYDCRMQLHYR